MNNFFTELEIFIKHCVGINTNGIFFEYKEAKIPFDIAEQIHARLTGDAEWIDELNETLSEKDDFIRLLRDENKRLRGKTDE